MYIAPADRIRGHTSLTIRRPRQRYQLPLAGEQVSHLDGISNSPDARIAGTHLAIDANAATFADFQTRIAREICFRAHPDGENHEVRIKRRSCLRTHHQSAVA